MYLPHHNTNDAPAKPLYNKAMRSLKVHKLNTFQAGISSESHVPIFEHKLACTKQYPRGVERFTDNWDDITCPQCRKSRPLNRPPDKRHLFSVLPKD